MDVAAFKKAGFFGAPFNSMASFLTLPEEQRKGDKLPGIPVLDSTDNQMTVWMRAIKDAYLGSKIEPVSKRR